jgi:GTP cyclohydrolase I
VVLQTVDVDDQEVVLGLVDDVDIVAGCGHHLVDEDLTKLTCKNKCWRFR